MSSELTIITPKSIEEAERMSKTLSASRLLPADLHQKPQDVLAIVLTGAELGLAPMQAIRGISIIKGKPTLAAETMGALVRRRSDVCEYLVLKESTPKVATYETKRRGDPSPTAMSFSMEDATRAGLNGDNWRKYPAAMLRARCLSAICKAVYSDLVLGLYDPDEIAPEAVLSPVPAVERDVTPARTVSEAKAKLAAVVAARQEAQSVEDAEVVDTETAKVVSLKGRAVLDSIRQHALDSGLTEKDAGDWMRSRGLTKIPQLVEADLGAFKEWAASVNAEPEPAEEAVPF